MNKLLVGGVVAVLAVGVVHAADGPSNGNAGRATPSGPSTSAASDSKDALGFLYLRFARVVVRPDGAHVRLGTYERWHTTAVHGCSSFRMTWPDNKRKVKVRFRHKYGLTALIMTNGGKHLTRVRVSHAHAHQVRFVLPKGVMGYVETVPWAAAAISPDGPGECSGAVGIDFIPEH